MEGELVKRVGMWSVVRLIVLSVGAQVSKSSSLDHTHYKSLPQCFLP